MAKSEKAVKLKEALARKLAPEPVTAKTLPFPVEPADMASVETQVTGRNFMNPGIGYSHTAPEFDYNLQPITDSPRTPMELTPLRLPDAKERAISSLYGVPIKYGPENMPTSADYADLVNQTQMDEKEKNALLDYMQGPSPKTTNAYGDLLNEHKWILPTLAVLETILTKGREPTTALNQQNILKEQNKEHELYDQQKQKNFAEIMKNYEAAQAKKDLLDAKANEPDFWTKLMASQQMAMGGEARAEERKIKAEERALEAPKPLPIAEVDKITDIENSMRQLNTIRDKFDKSFVGPFAGRYSGFKGSLGIADTKLADFLGAQQEFKNMLLKVRSGAAVTPGEAKRIETEVGNLVTNPEAYITVLNRSYESLKSGRNNAIENYKKANFNTQKLSNDTSRLFIRLTGDKETDKVEFDGMKSGTWFFDPNGKLRQKQ